MLSSMSPSIVIRDNDLYLVTGARGGPTILTSVFQQLMNTAVFGMDLEESFAVPRFHLRGPSRMEAETELYQSDLVRDLGNMGHENISEAAHLGGVNSILVNADGTLQAAGDPRGGYWASGQRSKSPKAEQPEKESEEKP